MTTILAAVVLIIVTGILWGVGAAVQRVTNSQSGPWPVSIGIGLAATVAAGGIVNLAHIAYGPVLWTLAGIELVISVLELRHVQWKFDYDRQAVIEIVSAAVIIGFVTIFAVATQLPPRVFNSHDDFEKYFAFPVRMLETGTLMGSPLSALGSEAVGGQTFLHGIVLSVLPISYINGVDAVFSMMILMLLTASAGWKRFSWFPGTLIGPLLVATINPQFVNVSASYSGALLMATVIILVAGVEKTRRTSPLVMGLLYGSMIAVKVTFVIFFAFHFPFVALAGRNAKQLWKELLTWSLKSVAWTGAFVTPWILLHLPNYLARGSLRHLPVPSAADGYLNLLSRERLFYGASFLDYTAVALVVASLGILGLVGLPPKMTPSTRKSSFVVIGGAISGALAYFFSVIVFGKAFGYAQSLRLAIPFILGACVTAMAMSPSLRGKWNSKSFVYLPIVTTLLICGMFVPSTIVRYQQASRFGSILAFRDLAQSSYYAKYNAFWLSPAGKEYIQSFQEKVPRNERLLAWINTPFLLDYRRNPIVDADTVGLASPWAHVPSDVRYVLWQYRGPEVRMDGDYEKAMHGPGYRERLFATCSLAFATHLSKVAQSSEVIASDGNFVLFKMPGEFDF